jgi:hypothetical protein
MALISIKAWTVSQNAMPPDLGILLRSYFNLVSSRYSCARGGIVSHFLFRIFLFVLVYFSGVGEAPDVYIEIPRVRKPMRGSEASLLKTCQSQTCLPLRRILLRRNRRRVVPSCCENPLLLLPRLMVAILRFVTCKPTSHLSYTSTLYLLRVSLCSVLHRGISEFCIE